MNRTNLSSSIESAAQNNTLQQSSHYIYAILFPLIFILGIVGNLFSSVIFCITKLNHISCGIYFLLLAIYDSLALIAGLHHCLAIGYNVPALSGAYCRVRNFLLYMSMDMTSWMVVAISVDRYLKARHPIKARIYATRKLSIFISCCLNVIFILKNFHLLTILIGNFTEDAADNCDPNPHYRMYSFFFNNIWPWIDFTTYALLPFILVTISNTFIIHDQYNRRFKLRKRTLDLSLIRLLLVSSISLVVCNLPISILAIIYPYISISYKTNKIYDNVAFAFDMLRLPAYISLGLNFYLYYYTSVLFRKQAIVLFQRLFHVEENTNHIQRAHRMFTDGSQRVETFSLFNNFGDFQSLSIPSLKDSCFISNFYPN
ncbi:unnamed protein product [Rotaria magnacalcarata]|uniref:G-protein coupled receptors family 1 profile domain-containing protein n=2 Tax=Rotaria magnacalcarata TaxID=392030 RepID=A0A814XAP4_9BILA|nr:unnamed protein product [Rotaria magnacalcarata]